MSESRTRMLVLSPFPALAAGTRFRIAQFIPYLEAHGFDVTMDCFFTPSVFNVLYRRGRYARKAVAFAGLALRRLASVARAGGYDVVFIYREAFPIGPPFVERYLRRLGVPIVLDFDDAIFLPNASEANRFAASLKRVQKMGTIVALADRVIVGNDYLADYARGHNEAVTTIPTCVDTTRYVPRADAPPAGARPVVGWIGSPTTAQYLGGLADVLRATSARHSFTLRVSGAGEPLALNGVEVDYVAWALDREVDLFNTCDVGVYPLTDDEWSRGKCGFKAIEFMACGVPVVASSVGVNRSIIEDGVNGFLAASPDEWIDKLGRLLTEPALRVRLAAAGRRTVQERYSLQVNAPRVLAAIKETVAARRGEGV